jgi:prevent-host-death family protein
MHVKKLINLVEARASLSRLTKEVAKGGGPIAITQRSKLTAVLVNAEQYEEDMKELEHYRCQGRKKSRPSFSTLMEIVGDLEEGSRQLAEEYYVAVKRSGDVLHDALRD